MPDVTKVFAPRDNVNDLEVTIVRHCVPDGAQVAADSPILEVETSKTVFDVLAPADGFVRHLTCEGDDVPITRPLCLLAPTREALAETIACDEDNERPEFTASISTPAQGTCVASPENCSEAYTLTPRTETSTTQRFSRRAMELMGQKKLSEQDFAGQGLVRERDVLRLLGELPPQQAEISHIAAESGLIVATDVELHNIPSHREKLSRSKRTEVERLTASSSETIGSQVSVLVPSQGIFSKFGTHPDVVGQMSTRIIFEVSRLMKRFPKLNARYERDHVVYYDDVNIGYAIDSEKGLKVLVFRNADNTSIEVLHERKQDFVLRYFEDKLAACDLSEGTITITDLSEQGTWLFNPIVNYGQAAILGIGGELALSGDRFAYPLILAFDHRVTEGLAASRFLESLRDRLVANEAVLLRQAGLLETTTIREPYCHACLKPLSEIQKMDRYLIKTIGRSGAERPMCTLCLEGW